MTMTEDMMTFATELLDASGPFDESDPVHALALWVLASLKKEPPLLQCTDCRNTESCAGAMARVFNQGRCLCGGYFKVVRA